MSRPFQNLVWEMKVQPPWRVTDCGYCLEITQPEGVGGLHISSARKLAGWVAEEELCSKIRADCPVDTDCEKLHCGDFSGYTAEYVDWHTNAYWRIWLLSCRQDMLHVTYTCDRGDEELELPDISVLLSTLRWKGDV